MNEGNVAIRLKVFIDSTDLTSSQFADQCGIPRPSLSQLLTGRNKKISDIIISQIHSAFPKLSVMWLLFGEGPMLTEENNKISENPAVESEKRQAQIANEQDKSLFIKIREERLNDEIKKLNSELEKLKKSPRKVSQITVYYDDSTFETFYPKSSL